MRRPNEDRFWSKVDVGVCWQWTSAVDSGGYGAFWLNGGNVVAHRQAWEMLIGPIPDGLELDHLCRNRACVNPDHLEPVTPLENSRRRSAIISHCRIGHPLVLGSRGKRFCPECARVRSREYQRQRRSAA
jgi:hypothetical protein